MNHKKRNNFNETNVKYAKNEKISLVTGGQVRQFYADEDRDSYKVERTRLFRNNPSPQHHFRYIPESRASNRSRKSKKSTFCGFNLKSKSKKIISYCLIYVLMFACAITLLYLFYTPKQMNLFGFYTNSNLRLKFYRFVLGKNATTITPKIITTTEPTVFFTHSSTASDVSTTERTTIKTKSISITHQPAIKSTSTTLKPNLLKTSTTQIIRTTTQETLESDKSIDSLETTFPSIDFDDNKDEFSDKKSENKIDTDSKKNKVLTTCVPVNVTESSLNPSSEYTQSTSSTQSSVSLNLSSTTKEPIKSSTTSKIIETLKKTSTTTTTIQPNKDNSTETLEFNEKFSYSNTQLSNMDKNETTYDETIVDNGVLPTEEEEEERRKDEIESKNKIASFFGVDPITGKEKNEKGSFLNDKKTKSVNNLDEINLMNKLVSNFESNQRPQSSNRWFLNGNQQFGNNRDFKPTKSPKDDELKYHPMLRLLYRNCNGECTKA